MAYAPTEILKKKKIHQLCEVFNLFLYTCYNCLNWIFKILAEVALLAVTYFRYPTKRLLIQYSAIGSIAQILI